MSESERKQTLNQLLSQLSLSSVRWRLFWISAVARINNIQNYESGIIKRTIMKFLFLRLKNHNKFY